MANVMQRIAAQSSATNLLISPFGVAAVLATIYQGAASKTKEQIKSVVGISHGGKFRQVVGHLLTKSSSKVI